MVDDLSSGVPKMHSVPILQYLHKHGQRMDTEIAEATGIPLLKVRTSLSDMSDRGEISRCSVTRFNDGKPVEGILCRIAGSIPPSTPGRKPGAKT
jgi:transcription initiation factor IIE alpha subunit